MSNCNKKLLTSRGLHVCNGREAVQNSWKRMRRTGGQVQRKRSVGRPRNRRHTCPANVLVSAASCPAELRLHCFCMVLCDSYHRERNKDVLSSLERMGPGDPRRRLRNKHLSQSMGLSDPHRREKNIQSGIR